MAIITMNLLLLMRVEAVTIETIFTLEMGAMVGTVTKTMKVVVTLEAIFIEKEIISFRRSVTRATKPSATSTANLSFSMTKIVEDPDFRREVTEEGTLVWIREAITKTCTIMDTSNTTITRTTGIINPKAMLQAGTQAAIVRIIVAQAEK